MRKLIVFVCLFFLLAVPGYAEEVTQIHTPQDLMAMAENPSGNYSLEADLDMSGIEWIPFDFSGTLEGNGHGILNLSVNHTGSSKANTYDGNLKQFETAFAGMFCRLENARIQNLQLINFRETIPSEEPCFIGSIAGYSLDSTISGCRITGSAELRAHDRMFGVGGVVGYGTGSVCSCSMNMTLICVDTDAASRDEQFLGGIYAAGFLGAEACEINIAGYISDHGYVHSGGITGMFMQEPIGTGRKATIAGNTVDGKITFFEDNTDRRAYCSAFIGEQLRTPDGSVQDNVENFLRDERFVYDRDLRPEQCETPDYSVRQINPTPESWGYTEYTCKTCGYEYADRYRLYAESVPEETSEETESIPDAVQETGESEKQEPEQFSAGIYISECVAAFFILLFLIKRRK